jgi:hypothetical protein
MNRSAQLSHSAKRLCRLLPAILACLILGVSTVRVASATDALYQNLGAVDYAVPGNPPPIIDARAFDNEGDFNVSFSVFSANAVFYEPMNTLFYTNSGTMTVGSAYLGNYVSYYRSFGTFGNGVRFDQQTTNALTPHLPADTFYNPGTIASGSQGQCIVSATNVLSPGVIQTGNDGFIQLTGQNVDLTRATLGMVSALSFNSPSVSSTGTVGVDTNADWNPGTDLAEFNATSSYSPTANKVVSLFDSVAYFDVKDDSLTTSNIVYRAVFIQNDNPDIPYSVYFRPPDLSNGGVNIEWAASYTDTATGDVIENYLYLDNNYMLGAATNVTVVGGVPENFTLETSDFPLIFDTPADEGYLDVFPLGAITNRFSYMNAQLIPTSTPTNASASNPSGALTNLPGRIQITASKSLNMDLARISGHNYLSLTATNQFEGSAGAEIASPYSDLNLGVTNGSLAVSNLLQSTLPNWSGNIQAWSTRWLQVIDGVTNDFRVMIVSSSQLVPFTQPQVQDLKLHATNDLVVSDVLNVLRTFSTDTRSLTLTTNGVGIGAGSQVGELNLLSGTTPWATATPHLRCLTNNGAIRLPSVAVFSGTDPVVTVLPGTPLAAATNRLSFLGGTNYLSGGGNVATNETVTIGSAVYTFVSTLKSGATNQVKIGTLFDGSLSNLIAAINYGTGSGTVYSSGTKPSTSVTAGKLTNHAFTVTAIVSGTAGNAIAVSTTSSHLAWSGAGTLIGGSNFFAGATNTSSVFAPYTAIVNKGLLSDVGSTIYSTYFANSGTFSSGAGSFNLSSQTAVLANGSIDAALDVGITSDTLDVSGTVISAGRSMTLQVTNRLTDGDSTNENIWFLGSTTGNNGIKLSVKPAAGDLRRTTIWSEAPVSKKVVNVWAGQDRGADPAGYTNNAAVGALFLDALGASPSTLFYFTGTGVSNALYVDYLEFLDEATARDTNGNLKALSFNTNLVIYYAKAYIDGSDVSDSINHKNGDHLRWVTNYAGYYDPTNIVLSSAVKAPLIQISGVDSDQDGIPNSSDPTPYFESTNVNLTLTMVPNSSQLKLSWQSIPRSTNTVYYTTSLGSPWLVLTNFIMPPPPPYGPITNILNDVINPTAARYYRVRVDPESTGP